ncbi:hypothetical protein [Maricaulis sp.]|uniref:hypothetical protein n=1 Tax=Maricaulis sp. TaxID=1486257 RepID=UPI003A94186B|tara:strand:- start:906 stop:1256 length:351 start_codon:yes stop_codon:yes gene_type:complete
MPRLTLVPPSSRNPTPCPTQELQAIIDDLHAARDGMTDGPEVLWLVNDLMSWCDSRIEDDDTQATGNAQLTLSRQNFMARLTGYAENIRRSNGEITDEFLAFLATAQTAMDAPTTN